MVNLVLADDSVMSLTCTSIETLAGARLPPFNVEEGLKAVKRSLEASSSLTGLTT